jgi:hypothetical protein
MLYYYDFARGFAVNWTAMVNFNEQDYSAVVCTENRIRVDEVREPPKLMRWLSVILNEFRCPLCVIGLNRSRDRVLRRAARATGYWDVSVLS